MRPILLLTLALSGMPCMPALFPTTFSMKLSCPAARLAPAISTSDSTRPDMRIALSYSVDSLGACQGASWINGRLFLYGDREIGMIREFGLKGDSLTYKGREYRLTINDTDLINHPTGIAFHAGMPTFMGNSVIMDRAANRWKAVIYCIDWEGLMRTGTLDKGNLLNVISDDTCIQGTRPEYVQYHGKWYVATADYGNRANEVRLYDPAALAKASRTSAPGVLYKKFTCGPWVQNLQWIPEKNILLMIQNQIEGRKWRFTFLDLEKSLDSGKAVVIRETDAFDRADELEGFTFFPGLRKGLAVTSSRKDNANLVEIIW